MSEGTTTAGDRAGWDCQSEDKPHTCYFPDCSCPREVAGALHQTTPALAVMARALCCKGLRCLAPDACPAEVPAHWSQKNAGFALAALTEAGFTVCQEKANG